MSADTTATSLNVSVESGEPGTRIVSVTVPAERVREIRRTIARQIGTRANLPGFRKGKLPMQVVERRFGPAIDQETLDRAIQDAYREAIDGEGIEPVSEAEVENVRYAPGEDLSFEAKVEVRPEPQLDRTEGFIVKRPPVEVGAEQVDGVVDQLRDEQAAWQPVPEGEKPGPDDRVKVEITRLDENDGAEPQEYQFVLGERQAIPDVEDAIRSLAAGEEGEFRPRFPDDFPDEEQRGVEQHLRIRLVEAHRKELPEADDEFAGSVGDFDSMETLRSRIEEDLRADADRRAESQVRTELLDRVIEANPFEVPGSMVDRYLRAMLHGGEAPQPRSDDERTRLEEAYERFRPQAEQSLRRMIVVETIARNEDLRATQDDIDARVEEIAERTGREPGQVWVELEKAGRISALENEIMEDRVFELLKSRNKVEE